MDFATYAAAEENTSLEQQQSSPGLFFSPVGVFPTRDIFIKHMLLFKKKYQLY